MSLDATEVAVALDGTVYVGDYGVTIPTGLTAPDPDDFDELGYVNEEGASFTQSLEHTDLMVWQSLDPIRRIRSSRTIGVSMMLRQFGPLTLPRALGGGTFTPGASVGVYQLPLPEDVQTVTVIVDAIDGDVTYRFVYPRMQISGDEVAITVNRSDSMNVPFNVTNLASSTQTEIRSDHPNWLT